MRFRRTATTVAVAAAVVLGLAPGAASAQDITVPTPPPGVPADVPVPPDATAGSVTTMSDAEVSAQADCSPVAQTYVTHPEWGSVPGACTTGPMRGETSDKILVDGDRGETIYDSAGNLVWFQPSTAPTQHDLKLDTYRGQPVLTYFRGQPSVVPGSGSGQYVILDTHYNEVAVVNAGPGLSADFHDMQIVDDKALVGSYPLGNLANGGLLPQPIVDYVVERIDIPTGNVEFTWKASDHVPFADTYFPFVPFVVSDYFHGNSITPTNDGNYLVSGRHTHSIYKIDSTTGDIIWTLGGKKSDFTLTDTSGAAAGDTPEFCWQHDALEQTDGTITLFDNAAAVGLPPSTRCGNTRGLDITLTPPSSGAKGTAVITRSFGDDPTRLAEFAGNYDALDDGGAFLGYGQLPIATRFDASGGSVLEVALTDASYRAHMAPFVGTPGGAPTAVVAPGGQVVVSWNGATEVRSWQLLDAAGAPVGSAQPKVGFETTLTVPAGTDPATLTVQALDAGGNPLTAENTTVTGSTYVSGLQVTAPVGPGSFDGATIALPPFTAGFSLLGIAPASVSLGIFPFANTVQSSFSPQGSTLTFQAKLKVTDFRVGPFPLQDFVGPSCQTADATTFTLTAPGDASAGSPLTGTYATSPFVGCGLLDPVASAALSRPDNTLSLTLPPGGVSVTAAGAR